MRAPEAGHAQRARAFGLHRQLRGTAPETGAHSKSRTPRSAWDSRGGEVARATLNPAGDASILDLWRGAYERSVSDEATA